jgi:hypothetical protein
MANSEKIEDIIDDKAFKQLERLLHDLGIAQNEFLNMAKAVETMNNNLSKVQNMKDLNTAMKDLEASGKKMQDAGDKAAATAAKVAKAENDIVAATKGRLLGMQEESKLLDSVSGSLEQNIRLQVKLKAELAQVREEQKASNTQMKTSDSAMASMSKKTAELASKEIELKAAIQQSNLDIRRAVKETNSAESSYDQLSAKLDRLRAAYRSLSEEERNNIQVGGALLASIEEYDKELKDLDKTMGVHNRNVGNYQSALSGLPGPIGDIINSFEGMAQGADSFNENMTNSQSGMAAFTAGIKSMAKAAWAFIATPIGMTLTAISAGLLAAKGWYDYNKNLVEATRLTKQLTGLSGTELKDLRAEIQATADVFGKDYNEVLKSSNALAKQFGISQGEALDLVNNGFVAGADASGDFLDQIREYSPQFEAAGISAGEMIAIMSQNQKEGIFSDKGVDTIKEAGLRIREMTPATQAAIEGIGLSSEAIINGLRDGTISVSDVIKQVSDKLGELPENSKEVGTAIADIFGGPGEDAGLAYIKTLGDIETDLDKMVAKTGEVGQAQLKQLEATEKLNKAWAGLFDATGGGFEMLIADAKVLWTEVLLKIITAVINLHNDFIGLEAAIERVFGTFKMHGANVLTFFGTIGKVISEFVSMDLNDLVKGDFSNISKVIQEGKDKINQDTKQAGEEIAQNYIDSINRRIKESDIEKVNIPTGSGGGKNEDNSKDDNTQDIELTEEQIKAIQQLKEAYIDLEISRTNRGADSAKKIAEDDQLALSDRLNNLDEYLKKREQAIILERDRELANKELTKHDITRIEEETQNALAALKTEGAAMSAEIIRDGLSQEDKDRTDAQAKVLAGIEKNRDEELNALNERYTSGELSEKEYSDNRLEIQREFTRKYVEQEIKAVQDLIDVNKARGIDVSDQERQLAALRLKLSQETTDQLIADGKKVADEDKKRVDERKANEEKLKDLKEELGWEIFEIGVTLVNARFEHEKNRLQEEADLIDVNKAKEIERINQSVASEEDKANRIKIVEARAQAQREAIERKQRDIDEKKARFDKMNTIARIIGETALKVIEYGGFTPPAMLIAAIGAAMIAKVIATPIPKYAKGTNASKEGPAIVGEVGSELVIDPSGAISMTPPRPTLTWLEKGTKIVPNNEVKQMMVNDSMASVANLPPQQNTELKHLVDSYKEGTNELKKAIKVLSSKGQHSTIIGKGGISYMYKKGNSWKEYLSRNGISNR